MNHEKENLHHAWSEARLYTTPLEIKLRTHRGFVIPSKVITHNYRHAKLGHPPKPTRNMMIDTLDYVGEFNPDRGRFRTLDDAVEIFKIIALESRSPERADLAMRVKENLEMQRYYLAMPVQEVLRITGN